MFDAVASTHSPQSDLTLGSITETITHISAELPRNFPSSTLCFSVKCHTLARLIPFKTVFRIADDRRTGLKGDRLERKLREKKKCKSLKSNATSPLGLARIVSVPMAGKQTFEVKR